MEFKLSKEVREERSKISKKIWDDPNYRKKLIKLQEKAGTRSYGARLNNKKNVTKRPDQPMTLSQEELDKYKDLI